MTNKVSLDKSKIKFVLLEGVHQSALDTLHAAGYTNIDFYKKALDGDELKEAIKDAHFIGLRSRTQLTAEMIEYIESGIPNIVCVQPFACLPTKWILMQQKCVGFQYLTHRSLIHVLWLN